jgi:hypothetical protein
MLMRTELLLRLMLDGCDNHGYSAWKCNGRLEFSYALDSSDSLYILALRPLLILFTSILISTDRESIKTYAFAVALSSINAMSDWFP